MSEVCWKCGTPPKASLTLASLLQPLHSNPSPDIAHLLRTNNAPLDSEIPVVRQIVSDGEERMRALDAQILHFQTTLAELSQRRIETTEHLRDHRAILSAVRRIPQEVIGEIFDVATAQSRAGPDGTPPWWLGFISHPWRQYALTYPALWSPLVVPAYPDTWRELWMSARVSVLAAQLIRSGTAPLDIHWSGVDGNSPDSRILVLMLPHSNSWRTVTFEMNYNKATINWLEPVRDRLDSLRKLEVVNARHTTFPDVFMTAPNLRHVSLPQVYIVNRQPPDYQMTIPIPWAQIIHYRGECPLPQQRDILQAAPNLSNCALDIADMFHNVALPLAYTTVVVLPHLRRICLDYTGYLLHIEAPNLEELCSVQSSWVIPRILPFVRRAACTLRKLTLWQSNLSAELITALRSLPSLTFILLHNHYHTEDDGIAFFDAMTVRGTTADVCPNLTSMIYGYDQWKSSASQDAFVSMVRSRFQLGGSSHHPSTSPFTSVRLLPSRSYSKCYLAPKASIMGQIQALQNEGFNVAFLGEGETTEYLRCRYI